MAQVLNGNQVKLQNGQTVSAQQGGWYDGQQFWGGTLSNPGQINSQSNQQGAGQQVSKEVIAQTNPQNVAYIEQRQAETAAQPAPTGGGALAGNIAGGGLGTGSVGGSGLGITPAPTLDLPGLYKSMSDAAGLSDIEKQIADKQQQAATTKAGINDNPWLSEGDRVGRIAKVDQLANDSIKGLQDTLAMKKADIQTQLDLQTKQFDINSQSAKQALDQFNTLLASGALSGASGEDIANITRATGMSSSMIQAAIKSTADKNRQTQTIQFDDGTNQGFAIIDQQTGQIISKQVISQSKPTKAAGGATVTKEQEGQQNYANAANDIKRGATLQQIVGNYGVPGGLTIDELYRLYNANSPRGAAKETLNQVKQGIYANVKGFKADPKKG